MHTDARYLDNSALIQGDICIIGAGTAGISIALEWMNTPYKVILLESGGFEFDDRIQDLGKGTSSGQKYYPLRAARLRLFGGTTGHWAGMCSPFDPVDFMKRDWVPHSGWPITLEDLHPYYERAHKVLQLGPYEYDLAYWQKEFPQFEPLPLDKDIIWNKMWQFSQARFITEYKEQIINASNIHLYTYANVADIEANEAGNQVKGLKVKNYAGKEFRVQASNYVLACGSIQNSRLLLASNNRKGLANGNDTVGRYFQEHLEVACAELWLKKPLSTDLYMWPTRPELTRAELGIKLSTQMQEQILNGTTSLTPLAASRIRKSRMETWQDEDSRKNMEDMFKRGREASEKTKYARGKITHAYQMNIRTEQAPNPNSRVRLGQEVDEFGVPLAHLHWDLTELDKRSARKFYEIIGREVGKAGIGRVRLFEFLWDENDPSFPESTNGGWHHMGTTRMSKDPKKGVVDANCQTHEVSNLLIAGAGCYATSAAPNPTLTLVALSLRLSDYLKGKMV